MSGNLSCVFSPRETTAVALECDVLENIEKQMIREVDCYQIVVFQTIVSNSIFFSKPYKFRYMLLLFEKEAF